MLAAVVLVKVAVGEDEAVSVGVDVIVVVGDAVGVPVWAKDFRGRVEELRDDGAAGPGMWLEDLTNIHS